MIALRRPAPLPLPACLLRTPRRLTSSRFSPSGKALPSSPLVLTASRRFAPLPLLLIALLALGGVLLWSMWSTPAQAQTVSRILVSNVAQGSDDSAATSGNDHAQLFHTGGATKGYLLSSVIVVSEDTQSDDFDVDVCEAHDTTEFPTSTCTRLAPPSSFAAGNLEFGHPGMPLNLNANDNYVVVIKQIGTGSVMLDSTTSGGEDTTGIYAGLTGWSIKNKFDWNNGGAWTQKSGSNEAIRITSTRCAGDCRPWRPSSNVHSPPRIFRLG